MALHESAYQTHKLRESLGAAATHEAREGSVLASADQRRNSSGANSPGTRRCALPLLYSLGGFADPEQPQRWVTCPHRVLWLWDATGKPPGGEGSFLYSTGTPERGGSTASHRERKQQVRGICSDRSERALSAANGAGKGSLHASAAAPVQNNNMRLSLWGEDWGRGRGFL
jgi:hypothetical protein